MQKTECSGKHIMCDEADATDGTYRGEHFLNIDDPLFKQVEIHNDHDRRIVAGDVDFRLRANHNSAASFFYSACW